MKYKGKIEAKEEKKTKTNTVYVCFTIDGKKWNCFDAIANQEFKVGDYVEFETEKKGEYENLIPETMKRIDAPVNVPNENGKKVVPSSQESNLKDGWKNETICKNINENPDSLEIGTPSKGGAIKIYGDFSAKGCKAFMEKIQRAKMIRDFANEHFSQPSAVILKEDEKVRDEANRILSGE